MRHVVLFCSFLFLTLAAACQSGLQGKWFMFSRNRLIEMTMTPERMVSRMLTWRLVEMDSEKDSSEIRKIVEAHGNIYLFTQKWGNGLSGVSQADAGKRRSLVTYRILSPDKEIMLVINSPDSAFAGEAAIDDYIKTDTATKYGIIWYSESELYRLLNQKSILHMTAADFKIIGNKWLACRAETDSLSKLLQGTASPNAIIYYSYARMRQIVGECGYNPLFVESDMDKLFQQFKDNPETAAVLKKLF